VPPRDPRALVEALRSLIRHQAARHTLGAAGPARAAVLCDPGARLREVSAVLARVGVPCR
jgi:hypothetical protein